MTSAEWFAGIFLLEAKLPDEPGDNDELFERRVVLFEGQDEAEAERKASEYCRSAGESYENESGGRVTWRCVRILDVTPLYVGELEDGVEVYSELLGGDPDAAPIRGSDGA